VSENTIIAYISNNYQSVCARRQVVNHDLLYFIIDGNLIVSFMSHMCNQVLICESTP